MLFDKTKEIGHRLILKVIFQILEPQKKYFFYATVSILIWKGAARISLKTKKSLKVIADLNLNSFKVIIWFLEFIARLNLNSFKVVKWFWEFSEIQFCKNAANMKPVFVGQTSSKFKSFQKITYFKFQNVQWNDYFKKLRNWSQSIQFITILAS
jgi:hypothetical protein